MRLTSSALLAGCFSVFLVGALRADDKPTYRVLAQDKGHVAIVNAKGEIEWEVRCDNNSHDISLLANGNFLLHTAAASSVSKCIRSSNWPMGSPTPAIGGLLTTCLES